MLDEDERMCSNCRYCDGEDPELFCGNQVSPRFDDIVEPFEKCPEWEEER